MTGSALPCRSTRRLAPLQYFVLGVASVDGDGVIKFTSGGAAIANGEIEALILGFAVIHAWQGQACRSGYGSVLRPQDVTSFIIEIIGFEGQFVVQKTGIKADIALVGHLPGDIGVGNNAFINCLQFGEG